MRQIRVAIWYAGHCCNCEREGASRLHADTLVFFWRLPKSMTVRQPVMSVLASICPHRSAGAEAFRTVFLASRANDPAVTVGPYLNIQRSSFALHKKGVTTDCCPVIFPEGKNFYKRMALFLQRAFQFPSSLRIVHRACD
jgi:hypothetical protein